MHEQAAGRLVVPTKRGWLRVPSLVPLGMVAASLCLSALFIRDGVGALQAARASALSDAGAWDRPATPTPPPDAREIGARILARNIFDTQTGPLTWDEPSAEPQRSPDVASAAALAAKPLQACEQPGLRLIASVVNAGRPEQSFAALRKDQKTHMLGIGDQLGEVTLLALRPAYAYVQASGTAPCVLPVFLPASQRPKAAPPPAKAAKAAAPAPRRKAKPLFSAEELTAAVRPLGPGRYAVSKAFLTRALGNPTVAARGARLRPVDRNGQTVGWELARLRKGSALEHMGLQKGDLLSSVNGHDLSDAGALLVALRMLQQADSVTLSIMRGNVRQNLQYTLD